MSQKKRITILLLGASLLLILTLAVPSGKPDGEPAPVVTSAHPAGVMPNGPAPRPGATKGQIARRRERAATLNWGRDPFADTSVLKQTPIRHVASGEPVLTGVSIRGAERWAIVSQRIVQVGDRLDSGYKVVAIERKSVTLEKDGKKLVLNLGENQ